MKNLFVTTGTMSEAVINKLWADVVMSRKMTTQMLAIGAFDNLIPDPSFTNAGNDWGTPTTLLSFPSNEGRTGGSAFKVAPSATQRGRYSQRIPTNGGETLRVTVWAKSDIDVAENRIGFFRNQTTPTNTAPHSPSNVLRQSNGFVGNDAFPANTWTQIAAVVTVPEGVTSIALGFYVQATFSAGTMWFSDASAVRMSGGELIVDGAITATKIAANAIESDKIKANAITGDKIEAGAIDGKIITGATIQTDNAENTGVKLTNTGIQAYSPEGEKTLSITGGRGVDFIGIWGNENATVDEETGNILYPTGVEPEQVASMNHEGEITGTALSIGGDTRLDGAVVMGGDPVNGHGSGYYGPAINGKDLLGASFVSHTDNLDLNTDSTAWMTPLPFGMVTRGYRQIQAMVVDRQEKAILEFNWEALAGRAYKITVSPFSAYTDAGAYGYLNLYGSTGTTRPTMNSTHLYSTAFRYAPSSGSALFPVGGSYYYLSGVTDRVNMLFTLAGSGGRVAVLDSGVSHFRVWVEDMGLSARDSSTDRNDLRAYGAPAPVIPPSDPAPIAPVKKTYTTTWNATWWGTWWASGGKTTTNSYFDSSGKVAQGNAPGVGLQRGAIGFPNITGTLSGSTIKKVEVYVYAAHWYANSGGTLYIGTHGHTSKPSSWSGGTTGVMSQKLAKPEGRWVTLPSSVHAGILSGSIRGIQAYASSTGYSYYGYLTGSKSKIRVTYVK